MSQKKSGYDPWFNLNVRSYFYMTKLVLPYMMEQRNGSIIERGSMADKVSLTVIPMGRGAEAIEIAQAACFLASDECPFINGINLLVDGGQACGPIRPDKI